MFYTIRELAKLTNLSQRELKSAIENGDLIPANFGERGGVQKISIVEYNRWALSKQYADHPELMKEAIRQMQLNYPVVQNG